jgi:hypothetical protein
LEKTMHAGSCFFSGGTRV